VAMTMATPLSSITGSPAKSTGVTDVGGQAGLTSDEARGRLEKFGPNGC
jgi:hypothetical protein